MAESFSRVKEGILQTAAKLLPMDDTDDSEDSEAPFLKELESSEEGYSEKEPDEEILSQALRLKLISLHIEIEDCSEPIPPVKNQSDLSAANLALCMQHPLSISMARHANLPMVFKHKDKGIEDTPPTPLKDLAPEAMSDEDEDEKSPLTMRKRKLQPEKKEEENLLQKSSPKHLQRERAVSSPKPEFYRDPALKERKHMAKRNRRSSFE